MIPLHHDGRALRGGCLKIVGPDGTFYVFWPGDSLYSSATMAATHYWSERTRGWEPITYEAAEGPPA